MMLLLSSVVFSQNNLWVVGNQLVDFNDPLNVSSSSLPTPTGFAHVYQGEVATHNQFAYWDLNGNLLFFIVDSNVYDKDGFLIADGGDLYAGDACSICLPKGEMGQLTVTPVPGSCSQFYLISTLSEPMSFFPAGLNVAILDLSLPNPFHPNRLGGLVDFSSYYEDLYFGAVNPNSFYADMFLQNVSFPNNLNTTAQYYSPQIQLIEGDMAVNLSNWPPVYPLDACDPYIGENLSTGDWPSMVSTTIPVPYSLDDAHPHGGIFIDIVDNNVNGVKQLFCLSRGTLSRYELTATGVIFKEAYNIPFPDNHSHRYFSDIECSWNSVTGEYIVAFLTDMDVPPPVGPMIIEAADLIVVGLNSNFEFTGNLSAYNTIAFFNGGSVANTLGITTSLEFTEDGQYLFFNQLNKAPYLGFVDLGSGTIHFVEDNLLIGNTISNPQDIVNSQIERGIYNGVECMYYVGPNGLSALLHPSIPGSMVFVSDAIPLPTVASTNSVHLISYNLSEYYLLSNHNFNDTQTQNVLSNQCCDYRWSEEAYCDETISGNGSLVYWQPGNNPFGNTTDVVKIDGNLTFAPGSNVYIQDMVFEFSENSSVKIDKDAYVIIDNTVWTSENCQNIMWKGVDIFGDPNMPQNLTNSVNHGVLRMVNNSVIENAWIGIQAGTHWTNSGAIVKAYNSTFRNNGTDVWFMPYSSMVNGEEYFNKSSFSNCNFVTDNLLNDPNVMPENHVHLWYISHVDFDNCSFMNTTTFDTYPIGSRGIGIVSKNALYEVEGANQPYDGEGDNLHDSFYLLDVGVKATGQRPFRVNKMEFQDCYKGIVSLGSQIDEISENNFYVPAFYGDSSLNFEVYPKAIHMINCSLFTIEENHVYGNAENTAELGFVIDNSGDEENEIYHNYFDLLQLGIYMVNDNGGAGLTNGGLQNRCNIFNSNVIDMYLAEGSSWRDDQGSVAFIEYLTNNKFSEAVGNNFPLYEDVLFSLLVSDYQTWVSEYFCIGDEWSKPNTVSDNLLIIVDSPYFNNTWNEGLCPNELVGYNWPEIPMAGEPEGMQAYLDAKGELQAAIDLYNVTVDQGQTVDLLSIINAAYPQESSYLRDLMMQRYPLSNEVMMAAIARTEPMDPWHLTQVMVANSRLDAEVLTFLEDSNVLTDFFMGFIYDAQLDNTLSFKSLLEAEISYRSMVKSDALSALLRYYNFQLHEDFSDQLYKDFLATEDADWARILLLNEELLSGNAAAVQSLQDNMTVADAERELLTGIKSVIFDPAHEPTANQINDLWLMYGGNGHYYGEALAMLHILGETSEIPEVILPSSARTQSTSFEEDKNRRKDWFGVYPNPVVDEVFLTYPEELDGIGQVSLINVLGQRVFSTIPKGGGIISVDMSSFPSGVYSLSITLDNQLLAKLSIVKL